MKARRIGTIARKEVSDSVRSRLVWTIVVLVAGLTSVAAGALKFVPGVEADALAGINGATEFAGLLVPIVALVAAYLAIAGERESGSVKVLLGFPPSRAEVVAGKFLGRGAVVAAAISAGYAVSGVVTVAVYGTLPVTAFVLTLLLTALLGVVFVGIAVGLSATTGTRSRAMTASIAVYLVLTLFWDLVPQGAHLLVQGSQPEPPLPGWFVLLQSLSPTGAYSSLVTAVVSWEAGLPGLSGLIAGDLPFYLEPWFLLLVLAAWAAVPLLVGYRAFERADLS
ncbi:ABC transporter permease subunit [Haloarchaeobius amylolyticus]|uniref:ABC transporter permease subunit n=1 Tax=Haloarchaeobius amylolyticus TaxID=1198296 RepID=UPI0022700DD0|nr:ABC transporter permease subunit [Haloarchaeobius amylolyticus]